MASTEPVGVAEGLDVSEEVGYNETTNGFMWDASIRIYLWIYNITNISTTHALYWWEVQKGSMLARKLERKSAETKQQMDLCEVHWYEYTSRKHDDKHLNELTELVGVTEGLDVGEEVGKEVGYVNKQHMDICEVHWYEYTSRIHDDKHRNNSPNLSGSQ